MDISINFGAQLRRISELRELLQVRAKGGVMWNIQCGTCGHDSEASRFFTSQKNRYVCPSCGVVWRIEHTGKASVTESGFVMPPRKICVIEEQMMLGLPCLS